MFKPKGLFSDITCPYNQECVLPQCLFSHPNDAAAASAAPNGLPDGRKTAEADKELVVPSEDEPRKRRKISRAITPPVITTKQDITVAKKDGAPGWAMSSTILPTSSKPLVSSQRRASPPSVKRQSNLKVDENAQSRAKNFVDASVPKPTAMQKSLKSETLNPRMTTFLKHHCVLAN